MARGQGGGRHPLVTIGTLPKSDEQDLVLVVVSADMSTGPGQTSGLARVASGQRRHGG